MTRDQIAGIGFQHPVRNRRPLTPRNVAFAELIMTSALVISIAVAATAVGIGIARADVPRARSAAAMTARSRSPRFSDC